MKKPYSVLSLDLGTHTGWALIQNDEYKYSGVLALPDHTVHPGRRFLSFQNWLHGFRGVNEIFYEDVPRFESNKSARVYCGLLSVLQIFCVVHGIRLVSIKPGTVKKAFTGNGNAKKDVMCKVAHQLGWTHGHLGTDVNHDEADALALAWVIYQKRGVELNFFHRG